MNSMATSACRTAVPLVYQGRDLLVAGCQVNPVVLSIRDHGPALLDGEFYRDTSAALLQRQSANSDESAAAGGTFTLGSLLQRSRGANIMITSLMALSLSLCCVGVYAWQQQYQVNQLQAELQLLNAAEEK